MQRSSGSWSRSNTNLDGMCSPAFSQFLLFLPVLFFSKKKLQSVFVVEMANTLNCFVPTPPPHLSLLPSWLLARGEKNMLRRSCCMLRVSTYYQFLLERRGAHRRVGVEARGKLLASEFRKLPEEAKAALSARAARTTAAKWSLTRNASRKKRRQKPHTYAIFVRNHYAKVSGTPQEKLSALGRLWKVNKVQ